jgi:hypothetical protein
MDPSVNDFIEPVKLEILHMLNLEVGSYTLQWVPGHSGIFGNERADTLASQGLTAVNSEQIPISLPYFLQQAEESNPDMPATCFLESLHFSKSELKRIRSQTSSLTRCMLRLILNHCRFRFQYAFPQAGTCPYCQAANPNPGHFVSLCNAPEVQATRLRSLEPKLDLKKHITDGYWSSLFSFFCA